MPRVFSGIQPTGEVHLGNYLGALRHWVARQHEHDSLFCVVDLHALTMPKEPSELRAKTLELSTLLLAIGLDPQVCTLFVQSQVPEHTELGWLMECTASVGELRRMTQFKEKGERAAFISAGLFTYPALQAADILLYDTDQVPVGDDQRQHLELARDLAERFNARFGPTFVVPAHTIPPVGARIMDLTDPTRKMSKSSESPQGTVSILDDPATVTRKIKRAVTDNDGEVRFDPVAKPGVSNLLSMLAASTGGAPGELAGAYDGYGALKADVAAAVIAELEPLQARFRELTADPGEVTRLLSAGADKARSIATVTMARARHAVGLLPRA